MPRKELGKLLWPHSRYRWRTLRPSSSPAPLPPPPPSPELLKCRRVLPGEAKLTAGEVEERKGAAESIRVASARLFHGVFLNIKSVTKCCFIVFHVKPFARWQIVFPPCDVLCTLVILCRRIFPFFSPLLRRTQNSLFGPNNQSTDDVNKKKMTINYS